jgi:hypothetical protein
MITFDAMQKRTRAILRSAGDFSLSWNLLDALHYRDLGAVAGPPRKLAT